MLLKIHGVGVGIFAGAYLAMLGHFLVIFLLLWLCVVVIIKGVW